MVYALPGCRRLNPGSAVPFLAPRSPIRRDDVWMLVRPGEANSPTETVLLVAATRKQLFCSSGPNHLSIPSPSPIAQGDGRGGWGFRGMRDASVSFSFYFPQLVKVLLNVGQQALLPSLLPSPTLSGFRLPYPPFQSHPDPIALAVVLPREPIN